MAKNIQLTKEQLQQIIKEGVAKLHKQTLIENRINQINEELADMAKPISEELGVMPTKTDAMEVLKAYLEAAIWADADEEWSGEVSVDDIDRGSVMKALEDVKSFINQAGPLLGNIDDSQVGHDLWLTRQGHGAGFWDRGLGEVGDKLSEIASEMGSKYLYRGDDGKVYID
jgi:hypothetical protein